MRYYAKFKNDCQPKNKAQEAAFNFGLAYDATLLSSDAALDKFVQKIQLGIDMINSRHRRCSDITYRSVKYPQKDDYRFFVGQIFIYTFYPVKQDLITEEPEPEKTQDLIGEKIGNIFEF